MSWRWPARTCPAGWSPGWPGWTRTCPPSSAPSAGTAACSPELHSPSWLHKHKHTTQSLQNVIFQVQKHAQCQHLTYYSCSGRADWQINSLGDDAAEERHIKPELLRHRVEAAHGSEVNQAVSGLLTVLDRNSSCGGIRTGELFNKQDENTKQPLLCDYDMKSWTCCADLNGSAGYRGLDVGHFERRQTGSVLGFTLSIQQLQTFTERNNIKDI